MALSCVSLLAATSRAQAQPNPTEWHRFTLGELEIVSDGGRSAISKIATRLSNLEFALTSFLPTAIRPGRHKLTVIAFADGAEYGRFVLDGSAEYMPGYMVSHHDESVIVLNLSEGSLRRMIMQHEFVHYWAQKYLPRLPMWLNEGLADYFSTIEVAGHFNDDGQSGIEVEIGRAVDMRVQTLSYSRKLMPARQMTGYGYSGQRHLGGEDIDLLYAQSWLTVHYMIVTDMGESLGEYIEGVRLRQDPYEVFQAVFQQTDDQFDRTLRSHFREYGGRYFQVRIDGTPLTRVDERSVLNSAQLLCYLAKICERPDERYLARAEELYAQASAQDSTLARAWVGRGDVAMMQDEPQDAIRFFRRALRVQDGSFDAHVNLGLTLLEDEETIEEAAEEFRRALEIEPTDPRALGYFAWSQIEIDPAKGLRAIAPVLVQLPWDDRFAAAAIVLMYRVGDLEAADAQLQEFQAWGSDELVAWVNEERSAAQVSE